MGDRRRYHKLRVHPRFGGRRRGRAGRRAAHAPGGVGPDPVQGCPVPAAGEPGKRQASRPPTPSSGHRAGMQGETSFAARRMAGPWFPWADGGPQAPLVATKARRSGGGAPKFPREPFPPEALHQALDVPEELAQGGPKGGHPSPVGVGGPLRVGGNGRVGRHRVHLTRAAPETPAERRDLTRDPIAGTRSAPSSVFSSRRLPRSVPTGVWGASVGWRPAFSPGSYTGNWPSGPGWWAGPEVNRRPSSQPRSLISTTDRRKRRVGDHLRV